MVVEGGGIDGDFAGQQPAVVVGGGGGGHRERLSSSEVAMVVELLGPDGEAGAGLEGVVLDAGDDDALVVDRLSGVQCDIAGAGQAAGDVDVEVIAGAHADGLAAMDVAAERGVGGFGLDRPAAGGVGQTQLAIGIDPDIAVAGGHVAGQFDAHAAVGADQADAAGVHAAQGRGVDGQRRGLARALASAGRQALDVDVVGAGDDVEVLGVDRGIDLGGAGNDVELIDLGSVEPQAFDRHPPLVDGEALQIAVLDDGLASGERDPRAVDEAAAVAGDAVRVGHHHVGRAASDFGVAFELTGPAAVDFVDDQPRRLAAQVGVADDQPTELGGLQLAGGIVEDHAAAADVVVGEFVVR